MKTFPDKHYMASIAHSEWQRMAARINLGLMKLCRLEQQVKQLKQELAVFEQEYFAALHAKLASYTALMQPSAPIPAGEQLEAEVQVMESLLQQLYRRLAKACHPDTNPQLPADTMQQVNAAYQQKELGSLILLAEQYCRQEESASFSFEDMTHYATHIAALVTELEQEKQALELSELNRLRRHIWVSRLQGRDVLADVAEQLRKQIYSLSA